MSRSAPCSRERPDIVRLVVGLGNPGPRYAQTRHNVGFMVLDLLAGAIAASWGEEPYEALLARGRWAGLDVYLLKPLTFMNLSGRAVAEACRRLRVAPAEIAVVHDDLDLPVGRLRLRRRGSAGGHRGVASVIAAVGTEEFGRVKIGIGRPPEGLTAADYVLQPFGREERPVVDQVLDRACRAVLTLLAEGYDAAMNRFND